MTKCEIENQKTQKAKGESINKMKFGTQNSGKLEKDAKFLENQLSATMKTKI